MLMLQGVAILVLGAVVRGLVVLEAWSHEQSLPRRGGAKPWCSSCSKAWMDGVAGASAWSCCTGSYGRLSMPAEDDVANPHLVSSTHVMST